MHFKLLSKLPPSCHEMCKKHSRRMYHDQACGYSAPRIPLKDLLESAIVDVLHNKGHGANALAHAAPPDEAIMLADRDGRRRQRPGPSRGGRSRACTICGEEGHSHFDCTKSCRTCHLRRCPGTYGKACAVHSIRRIAHISSPMRWEDNNPAKYMRIYWRPGARRIRVRLKLTKSREAKRVKLSEGSDAQQTSLSTAIAMSTSPMRNTGRRRWWALRGRRC